MEHLKLSALGRFANLGSIYDVRREQFIPTISLFNESIPDSLINTIDVGRTTYKHDSNDSVTSKFEKFGINAELKISVLCGLVTGGGSCKYFTEEKRNEKSVKVTSIYNSKTKNLSINLTDRQFKGMFSSEILENKESGTHVVVGIEWGANVFFTFEHKNTNNQDKKKIEASLKGECKWGSGSIKFDSNNNKTEVKDEVTFNFNGDISPDTLPTSWEEAKNFNSEIPKYIKANGGKGVPLEYILVPLNQAVQFFDLTMKTDIILKRLQEETIKSVEDDEFSDKIKSCELNFKGGLKSALINVRSGNEETTVLDDLIVKFIEEKRSSEIITFLGDNLFLKRKEQIKELKYNGLIYMEKEKSLSSFRDEETTYVLIFSEDSMKDETYEKEWDL